ncbi:MAG TPA: GNAT family N-acetyltransferase [Tepidisphaeraceae bacterium]|nr:GNAT family N-acetyltransferase [Tepidisphaeraceae bacterium]
MADRTTFDAYFKTLVEPLSDYTFSQFYTWRNSLRILWKEIEGNLCVFANGSGDLTLLAPPVGETRGESALKQAYELMDEYNAAKGVLERSRVEYVSEELLGRFGREACEVEPLGTDYVYDVQRMIDLAGGDLASKRQAKNRFMRNYKFRVEAYDRVRHLGQCLNLLAAWKGRTHQGENEVQSTDAEPPSLDAIKREKESLAAELTLDAAEQLGLRGMVVYVEEEGKEQVRGFTFGEALGHDQSSITVEKTDLGVKGLAQYIFSKFCAREWGHRPLVNVGDDWGLESLAWTKMSYRPVKLLQKYVMKRKKKIVVSVPGRDDSRHGEIGVRAAGEGDLAAAVELERSCFTAHSLKKRQLQYLQQRRSAIFLVAEEGGRVIGDGIALVRKHKSGLTGRIYSLAVASEFRGKGIGLKLLDAMVDSLAARGVRRVYLEVDAANEAAMRLYDRAGFRRLGSLPDYYGEGKDGVHMVKEIGMKEAVAER